MEQRRRAAPEADHVPFGHLGRRKTAGPTSKAPPVSGTADRAMQPLVYAKVNCLLSPDGKNALFALVFADTGHASNTFTHIKLSGSSNFYVVLRHKRTGSCRMSSTCGGSR